MVKHSNFYMEYYRRAILSIHFNSNSVEQTIIFCLFHKLLTYIHADLSRSRAFEIRTDCYASGWTDDWG